MATITTLAAEYHIQPYEMADALNLSHDDYHAEMDAEDEAFYRAALDDMAREYQAAHEDDDQ